MHRKTGFQKYHKMSNFDKIAKIFVLQGVWKRETKCWNICKTPLKIIKRVLKEKNLKNKTLIKASPSNFLMIYQTRKKPGTRFWPFFKPEKPVLKDRPEMETLLQSKHVQTYHNIFIMIY